MTDPNIDKSKYDQAGNPIAPAIDTSKYDSAGYPIKIAETPIQQKPPEISKETFPRNPGPSTPPVVPTTPVAPDYKTIADEQRKRADEQIGNIAKEFAAKTATERQVGEERLNETNALSRSMIGSTYASKAFRTTGDINQRQLDLLEAEKASRIAEVLGSAEKNAMEWYKIKRGEYEYDFEQSKAKQKELETKAQNSFKILSSNSGKTWNEYKTLDPNGAKGYLDQLGYDDVEASYLWDGSKSQAEQPEVIDKHYDSTTGSYVIIKKNPKTGAVTREELKPSTPLPVGYDLTTIDLGGTKKLVLAPKVFDPTKPLNEQIIDYATYKVTKEPGSTTPGDFKLSNDNTGQLLASGFSKVDIEGIQNDINKGFSVDEIGQNILTNGGNQKQVDALKSTIGGASYTQQNKSTESKLTRENISNLFDIPDNDKGSSFLGFKTGKTNKEKLDEYMKTVEKNQKIGIKDAEIIKILKEEE